MTTEMAGCDAMSPLMTAIRPDRAGQYPRIAQNISLHASRDQLRRRSASRACLRAVGTSADLIAFQPLSRWRSDSNLFCRLSTSRSSRGDKYLWYILRTILNSLRNDSYWDIVLLASCRR